jgi:uncharacterized membrane protein SirB2
VLRVPESASVTQCAAMTYLVLKTIHVLAATATISGFLLRGYWMLTESEKLQRRVTRIVPHVVDTILLVSGVATLWLLQLNPFTQTWLVAKFSGLIAYILLGTIAIKRGKTLQIRLIALVGAVSVFAYIAGVAITKSPLSWLMVPVTL